MSSGSAGWHSRLLLADIFGDQVDISIRGHKKFQTFFGAFLGLFAMLFVAAYSVGVVIDIVDVSTPEVSSEDKYDYENHSFDISNSELLPMFTLLDRSSGKAYDCSEMQYIMKPVANFLDQSKSSIPQGQSGENKPSGSPPAGAPPSGGGAGGSPPSGGSGGMGSSPTSPGTTPKSPGGQTAALSLEWVPCVNLTNKAAYARLINNNFQNSDSARSAWCLEIPKDSSAYRIIGSTMSKNSTMLRVQFYPCTAATCYNSSVLDKISVNMVNIKSYLQYSNFREPVQRISQASNDISLNTELGSFFAFYLRTVKVSSTTNWFIGSSPDQEFTDIIKENVYSFNRAVSNCSGTQECLPFFAIEYRSSGIVTTHKRKYTELLSATSNIGGLKELVMVVGLFIYGWYNQIFQRRYVSNAILSKEELSSLALYTQNQEPQDHYQPAPLHSKKVDSSPLGTQPAIQTNPYQSPTPAPDQNATTPTALGSAARLAVPKFGFEVSRVRPRSRAKVPAGLTAKPHDVSVVPSFVVPVDVGAVTPPVTSAKGVMTGKGVMPKVVLQGASAAETEGGRENGEDPRSRNRKDLSQSGAGLEDPWTKSLRLEADKLAHEILSIETLLTELATVRVLTRMIFSDHHKKLVPLVEIECQRRRLEEQEQTAAETQQRSTARRRWDSDASRQYVQQNDVGSMSLSQAIEILKISHQSLENSAQRPGHLESSFGFGESLQKLYRPLIDRYFAELLLGVPDQPRPSGPTEISSHVKSPVASHRASHTALQHNPGRMSKPATMTQGSSTQNVELQELDL